MSAAPETPVPPARSRFTVPEVPAPDTPEGRVVAVSLIVGAVFVLLLVGVTTPLADQAGAWVPLVLILATVLSLALSTRLLTDRSNVRMVELELARSASVHTATGQIPDAQSPIGGVLREYVHTADEMRRHWRTDAYAAGPAMWGAVLALLAAIFWGLSFSTASPFVNYIAAWVELPALVFLIFSVAVIATGIGQARPVPGFETLTPHRWRGFSERTPALDAAVAGLPWLEEYARSLRGPPAPTPARPAPWVEPAAGSN
jgi:hypothetical protein